VENGRLIQAVAVASSDPGVFEWTFRGKFQLVQRFFGEVPKVGLGYSVVAEPDGQVLSVQCNLSYCLDLQIFVNGVPLDLRNSFSQTPEFAEVKYSDTLSITKDDKDLEKARVIVAVYSLRDKTSNPKPKAQEKLEWEGIQNVIGSDKSENLLSEDLKKNARIEQLTGIPPIIARSVEQLLSVAALSQPTKTEFPGIYLIHSLVGFDKLKINYELCL
jgi:hypothetical protein